MPRVFVMRVEEGGRVRVEGMRGTGDRVLGMELEGGALGLEVLVRWTRGSRYVRSGS